MTRAASDVRQDRAVTPSRPKFRWSFFVWPWLAFWILLFLLGLQEYQWEGGRGLWEPALEYSTAALVSTTIGVLQLNRARHIDRWLSRPARWFLALWQWMPLEALGFLSALFAVPRVISWLFGIAYEKDYWLRVEAYDCAKFLLFYFLAGGIQFGIFTYDAWTRERLRSTEHARLAQEAQLMQLTQQLQPHFLFNCLNAISSLIYIDPGLADTLLGRLATLLRAATGASRRPEQSLEEELALLRAYAEIMIQRFPDRVHVEWSIDENALRCLVPTFGLQPLLENCFHHVVEKRGAPTCIVVRARRQTTMLIVEIEDDGDLRAKPPVHGVGLENLKRRLESLHGEQAHVVLLPRPEHGLIVRVELPCAC